MRPVIAKRQGIGSTAVRAAVLSLALMVGEPAPVSRTVQV